MARIAFCLPALPSHAAVHGVFARQLMARGHSCRMIGSADLGALAQAEGVGFGSLGLPAQDLRGAGRIRTLRATAAATRAFIRHGPQILADFGPDIVIVDQAEPGASLAAEAAGLPRVTLAAALPLDRDMAIPPPFVNWPWQGGAQGLKRNRGGWRVTDLLMTLQARALAQGCRDHNLPLRRHMDGWISPDLDLRQMIGTLDFPHRLPPSARIVGPLRDDATGGLDADTDGRPLVFASLGTLQGARKDLLVQIAKAAAAQGICLALAHGGALSEAEIRALPGRHILRARFPQRAALAQSAACITHGGLNTVLDCAEFQVPMVVIPLAFEQPAIAARLAYHGAATVIAPRRAQAASIAAGLAAVLQDPAYRRALAAPAAEIAASGGAAKAADLLEAHLMARARRAS